MYSTPEELQIKETRIQWRTEEIRSRSKKSNAQYRKELLEWEKRVAGRPIQISEYVPEEKRQVGLLEQERIRDAELETLNHYHLEDFADEDRERDEHMVTSADLLDLHLSELEDFKRTGQPGFYSRRTERLLKRVTNGFVWTFQNNDRFRKEHERKGYIGIGRRIMPGREAHAMVDFNKLNEQLAGTNDPVTMLRLIHQILILMHTSLFYTYYDRSISLIPIKDLHWEVQLQGQQTGVVKQFLDFLSNDLS